jgi:hypothetical protein
MMSEARTIPCWISVENRLHVSAKHLSSIVCLATVFFGVVPITAHAQSPNSTIPDNARARSYGSGWECNRGFRETAERCVTVDVPANAYLSPEGTSWTCDRGFRAEGAKCVSVQVPAHGYAVDARYDKGWRCNRGYRIVGERCVQLEIPANAYATEAS